MRSFVCENLCHLFADNDRLGIAPFDDISVGEKANLLIDGNHVQSLGHHVANSAGEEVVPPKTRQAEIGQFTAHRAQGLVGVTAGNEALETEPRVAADDLRQLSQCLL